MGDKTGSSSGSFLDQLFEIVNDQGGDFEIVNNQGGDFEEEKVSEPESTTSFLDSLLNIEREGEKIRSSFEGESIFDPLDEESIFHGLELPENPAAGPTTGSSQDKFLNSLISLLVENTNIEEEFSDFDEEILPTLTEISTNSFSLDTNVKVSACVSLTKLHLRMTNSSEKIHTVGSLRSIFTNIF